MEEWEKELEEIMDDPEKLHKFLDETNFDYFHPLPREIYFPILKGYERGH